MAADIHQFPDLSSDSEKITINPGFVDLGHIDLLVQDSFYSNRTNFIRTAIRNQIASHAGEAKKSITRQTLDLRLRHYTRADLEAVRASGEKLRIKVLGLVAFAPDITPELALSTIEPITVLGAFNAGKQLKAALGVYIK